MQTTHTTTTPQDTPDTGTRGLDALAGFDGPPSRFLPALLAALHRDTPGSGGLALLGLEPGKEPTLLACEPAVPEGQSGGGVWHEFIQRLAQDDAAALKRPSLMPLRRGDASGVAAHLAAVPVLAPQTGDPRAMLCMLVRTPDAAVAQRGLGRLELAAQVLARYELGRSLAEREADLRGLTRAMRCVDAVNREERFRTAGIALCNEIADTWSASRVAIGFMAGRYVKLRAMSHTEDINRKMQLVQDLESAMEECIDQDVELRVPRDESATVINRQCRLFTEKHGPTRMCVLPLRLHDEVIGALSIELPTDHALTPDQVESLRLAANLFTARLHQFHLDDRWAGVRLAAALRRGAASVVGPHHTWAKLVAIGGVGFLAFAFLAKGNDTVNASFTVQTTQRQVVTAPFAGTLLSVGAGIEINEPVTGLDAADAAEAATVLAVMDTSELRVERAALDAQIADYRARADAARGEGDLASVEVALANVRRLEAEARLYDYRIARSTLTSPISGVIVEGDPRQRVNGSLEKGEVLFEIAPLDALRAELLVPANKIGAVRSRLEDPANPSRGELASASHPGRFIRFTVERVEPEAEVVEGQNVFRVRVSLDEQAPWLRPGVEGEARVHAGRRSYAYLWTRDAVNWVRMKLWL